MVGYEARHLGFTGTQTRLSLPQFSALQTILRLFRAKGYDYLHHGDCVGADAAAHEVWTALKGMTHAHPPDNPVKRANTVNTITSKEKPYLERNKDIVKACREMVACPATMGEELRSGTWATVRYAEKTGSEIILIFPDGSIKVR